MRFVMLSLLGLSLSYVHVASEPKPGKVLLLKGGQASYITKTARRAMTAENRNDHVLAEFRQAEQQTDDFEDYNDHSRSNRNNVVKARDSNARLFIRKFMRLKNLFGNNNQPIIIRVFLNGTSASPNIPATNPTVPTNPTAPTGVIVPTIPTNPTAPTGVIVPTIPTNPTAPTGVIVPTVPTNPTAPTGPAVQPTVPTNPTAPTGPPIPSVPTVPTNPTAPTGPPNPSVPTVPTNPTAPTGAPIPSPPTIPTNPLIPRNDDLYGTDDDNISSELPARVHYQHKVTNKNHAIIVRIPAKYKHLFSNGQQVKISTKNGVKRRRVANKRKNVNHKKQNSNKSMRNKTKLSRIISI